jgi:murein DD-endopeptidase MepM/ murein hydrolase activator NlpD
MLWRAAALLVLAGPLAALELNGELQQGGMVLGQVAPGAGLNLDGKPVKVAPDGRFVIGFGREAPARATLEVRNGGEVSEHVLAVAPRQFRIQRIEGVPQRTVTPDPQDLDRIRAEARLVKAARANSSEQMAFAEPFRWPLLGPITGVYGSQRIYNGTPGNPHYGVDVAAPVGTPVVAPAAGRVVLAHPDMFYSGGTLIIDHGYGVNSTFIHLSRILVEVGDEVAAGDAVAEVGATGRATGPHLDWRINWFDVRLDPQLVVGPMPGPAGGEK